MFFFWFLAGLLTLSFHLSRKSSQAPKLFSCTVAACEGLRTRLLRRSTLAASPVGVLSSTTGAGGGGSGGSKFSARGIGGGVLHMRAVTKDDVLVTTGAVSTTLVGSAVTGETEAGPQDATLLALLLSSRPRSGK